MRPLAALARALFPESGGSSSLFGSSGGDPGTSAFWLSGASGVARNCVGGGFYRAPRPASSQSFRAREPRVHSSGSSLEVSVESQMPLPSLDSTPPGPKSETRAQESTQTL